MGIVARIPGLSAVVEVRRVQKLERGAIAVRPTWPLPTIVVAHFVDNVAAGINQTDGLPTVSEHPECLQRLWVGLRAENHGLWQIVGDA